MYKLLLTGFDPFGEHRINPSFQIAQTLAFRNNIPGVRINAYEMPTKWDVPAQILRQIIIRNEYDGLIMVGLSANRTVISLEETAQNLDDSDVTDNSGIPRHKQIIDKSTPDYLHTNLPIDKFTHELLMEGYPVEISHSAGNYICNHLYFHALNMPERPRDVLFVHIPPTDEMKSTNPQYTDTLSFNLIENFFTSLITKIINVC
jgi:pyroglutamyl-peptidase